MKRKRLLIVDDIEEYCDALEMMLGRKYEVKRAKSYDEGVKILEEEKIDIAIIDIRLDEEDPSNRDGLKLLKWIRENSPHTIPFVTSAYKEFDYAVEALNLGAKYFFKKPLKPDEIKETLSKWTEETE